MSIRFDFAGKVVGITGAASQRGIGFAIAKGFAQSGARVFVCDLNEQALLEAREALAAFGDVRAYALDVSDEAAVAAMFDAVEHDLGSPDIFVNNAGIYPQCLLCDMTVRQWETTLNVNLKSVFLCCREFYRRRKDKGGVLINAASYAALLASAGSGAYAASKSGVYSLTRTLAAELAPYGIRVNGFIPGVIETGMTQVVVDQKRGELEQAIALRRLGTPEDVASAVLYLASEESGYLTGTFIEVSGGKLCVQNPDFAWKKAEEARRG